MPYDKTGDDGRFKPTYNRAAFLDAIKRLELPTTADVADTVGCAHRTALYHLNEMEDTGLLESRMIGRAKLWTATQFQQETNTLQTHTDTHDDPNDGTDSSPDTRMEAADEPIDTETYDPTEEF